MGRLIIMIVVALAGCSIQSNQAVLIDPTQISGATGMLALVQENSNGTISILDHTDILNFDQLSLTSDFSVKGKQYLLLISYDDVKAGTIPVIVNPGDVVTELRCPRPVAMYSSTVGKSTVLSPVTSDSSDLLLMQKAMGMIYVPWKLGDPTPVPVDPAPKVPNEFNSTIPHLLFLIGGANDGSTFTPDPKGSMTLLIRDELNNPVENARVVADFNDCNYVSLAMETPTLSCHPNSSASRTISAYTDATGKAKFTAVGALSDFSFGKSGNGNCLNLFVNGINFTDHKSSIRPLDLQKTGNLTGQLTYIIGDMGTTNFRTDYDDNGIVDSADLTIWNSYFGTSPDTDGLNGIWCDP